MKPNSWYLEKLQIDSRQRHAQPIPIKKIKAMGAKKGCIKGYKQGIKLKPRCEKGEWDYPIEKLVRVIVETPKLPKPSKKEVHKNAFLEKQARIKAVAENVNKAIGLKNEDLFFNEKESER